MNPIPPGYEGALPYLCCRDAEKILDFYREAFGGREIMRLNMPDGRIGHAEMEVAGACIMVSDEFPDWGCLSPETLNGSPITVMIYVKDVDAFAARAISAGAEVLMPLDDQFYGDRCCKLRDPAGHTWMFASRVEEVSVEEMQRRLNAKCAEPPPPKS